MQLIRTGVGTRTLPAAHERLVEWNSVVFHFLHKILPADARRQMHLFVADVKNTVTKHFVIAWKGNGHVADAHGGVRYRGNL